MNNLAKQQCKPQRQGIKPLSLPVIKSLMERLDTEWQLEETATKKFIHRQFNLGSFHETIAFINAVAWITHQQNHYPQITADEATCQIRYMTVSVDGLTLNDFICAAKIDFLLNQTQVPSLTAAPAKNYSHEEKEEEEEEEEEELLKATSIVNETPARHKVKPSARQNQHETLSSATPGKNNTGFRTRRNNRAKPETTVRPTLPKKPFASEYLQNLESRSQNKPASTAATENRESKTEKTLPYTEPNLPERTLVMMNPYHEQAAPPSIPYGHADEELEQRTLIMAMPTLRKGLHLETETLGQPGNSDHPEPDNAEELLDPDEVPTLIYNPETDKNPSPLGELTPLHKNEEDGNDQTIPDAKLLDMERTQILLAVDRETGLPSNWQSELAHNTGKSDKRRNYQVNSEFMDAAIENDDTLVMHANTFARVQE